MTQISRTAFTPGPWKVTPRGGLGYDVDGPDGALSGTRGMFDKEADARLASESPAMYEALRALLLAARSWKQRGLAARCIEADDLLARIDGVDQEEK